MMAMTERVRRFVRRVRRPIRCSACQQPRGAGRRLISGPGVYICETCVDATVAQTAEADARTKCSFCGRRNVPIAGSWKDVTICKACVELARDILGEDAR